MKTIFLFPGQGAQYVGMGKDLYENFPQIVGHVFEEAEDALKIKLKKLCFEGPESDLKLTANTQPSILTVSIAALKVFQSEIDIKPSLLAGHSLGEYTALVAAGSLSFSKAVQLTHLRGLAMQEAVPVGRGAMAALLGIEADSAVQLCREVSKKDSIVSVANFNGGGQVVVAGHADAIKKCVELAPQKGAKRALLLEVSAPFHCELMKPAAEKMGRILETISFSKPKTSYIANVDAKIYSDLEPIRTLLIQQIPNSVQWEASMKLLQQQEIESAIEIGPGKVLTGLLRRINKEIKLFNVQNKEDLKVFL